MNSYELSRAWFNWSFENPEKIKPVHTALYFFCIDHCNRLGWCENFGLPTSLAKSAIGIHSYNTYIDALNDLVAWGFIKMIQKSKNQYTSNIIAISKFNKPINKALDKALINHVTKQDESIVQSIDSINKQQTNKQQTTNSIYPTLQEVEEYFDLHGYSKESACIAFQYYASANWKDSKGKQVKAWKQKMHGVWFKPENKKTAEPKKYISYIPENENTW